MHPRRFAVPLALAALVVAAAARAGQDTNAEIWTIRIDGRGQRNLTQNPALDYAPTPSPDGRRIAFFSTRTGRGELYVMDADGSHVRRLTAGPLPDDGVVPEVDEARIDWSPDGKLLAFNGGWFREPCSRLCFIRSIYVVGADGRGLRLLAEAARNPDWSPDGRRLVIESEITPYGEPTEIATIAATGGGRRRLASTPAGFAAEPAWSPRGRTIAFTINGWVALVSAQGGAIRRLSRGAQQVWSPNGRFLAYVSPPPAFRVVVRRVASGTGRRVAAGGWPRWSPSGAWISYVVDGGLGVVSSDGKRRRVVLPADGFRRFSGPPEWLRGGRIAYALLPR
jgi:Tol biopolymer transport system component